MGKSHQFCINHFVKKLTWRVIKVSDGDNGLIFVLLSEIIGFYFVNDSVESLIEQYSMKINSHI